MVELDQLNERAILQERVAARLAGFFGGLALALAAIGLYGLMAYAVTQRTRELAIRRVLGAQPQEVVRMVVRETLVLVLMGIGIGLPLALVSGGIVRSLLFGVTPTDSIALARGIFRAVEAAEFRPWTLCDRSAPPRGVPY